MTSTPGDVPAHLRDAILKEFPELVVARLEVLGEGWHSTAIDADGQLVFKFPRHEIARGALVKEAALIAAVRPMLTIAVPDLRIHNGPPLFSSHQKIHGQHLLSSDYAALPDTARDRLAAEIARFYVEIHGQPLQRMTTAGATPIAPWQSSAAMRSAALPALPAELRHAAAEIISAYERLPADPLGMVYGFFDGHGWNMAFDFGTQRLNGIYDFADSGLGSRHQEFIYTNLISPDLTERVIRAYEALAGLSLDRERIATLTGAHRLSELAELAHDATHAPTMVQAAVEWLSHGRLRG
jgi:hypothetical protein